jgi:hypothetical protein
VDIIYEMITEFVRLTGRQPSRIVIGQNIADRIRVLSHPQISRTNDKFRPYAVYDVPLLFVSSDVLEVASDDPHVQLDYLPYRKTT